MCAGGGSQQRQVEAHVERRPVLAEVLHEEPVDERRSVGGSPTCKPLAAELLEKAPHCSRRNKAVLPRVSIAQRPQTRQFSDDKASSHAERALTDPYAEKKKPWGLYLFLVAVALFAAFAWVLRDHFK